VAAISVHHDLVELKLVGLNPPCSLFIPFWDLTVVLSTLQRALFEPLQSVKLKFLSMKTVVLVALASIKRVRELQAFSVDKACLEVRPANSLVLVYQTQGQP